MQDCHTKLLKLNIKARPDIPQISTVKCKPFIHISYLVGHIDFFLFIQSIFIKQLAELLDLRKVRSQNFKTDLRD